jgi:FkbM family methyltransferase
VIYAIEADGSRFRRLEQRCDEWARAWPRGNRIVALNVALSDQVGEASFFVTDDDCSGGLFPTDELAQSPEKHRWRQIEVKGTTLDAIFSDVEPDLVKMDVEGGEYRVLMGSLGLLRKGKTRFLVEVHPWGDPSIGKRESDVFDLFAGFGYDYRRLHHHWVFAKSRNHSMVWLKNKLIHVVLDRPSVRRIVRSFFRGPR